MTSRSLLKENAGLLELIQRFLDPLLVVASGVVLYAIQFGTLDFPRNYIFVLTGGFLLCLAVFPFFNIYRPYRGAGLLAETQMLASAWAVMCTGLVMALFATKTSTDFSRLWIGLWAVVGFLSLVVFRMVLRGGLRFLRSHGFNLRYIAIAGAGDLGREVASRLAASPWTGLKVVGFYDDDPRLQRQTVEGVQVRGDLHRISSEVEELGINQVWIALPLKAEDKVRSLLHELRHSAVDIRFIPDIFGFRLLNHSVTEVAGFPVMNLSVTPMMGVNRVVKALEDRVLASLILLLVSPFLLLIALGVKLSSPGPVFYRQERVGWNGKPFMMLKFRSMPVGVEKNGVQWGGARSMEATPFGVFLRRTSLDELPQFINVLNGDMSIVGPRPERPMFVEKFKDEIPDYMKKHLVKAGITGWAQIAGWRGDTDLTKRIEYDLYYIEHWSLWFDLRIILLTVFKGFISKNAY